MKSHKRNSFANLVALAIALTPSAVWSATTTIAASKDNTIFEQNAAYSGGGGAGIFVGTNGMDSPRRGLIAFDVAANVPAGSTITSASLTLYLGTTPNSDAQEIELHKLTRDWGEGTAGSTNPSIMMSGQGYPASAGDATWNDAQFGSVSWLNLGAVGDFSATASASTSVSGPVDTAFTWASSTALVSDVQGWLDAPATNFGWLLFNTNEATNRSIKAFYSREATQNSTNVPNSLDPTWRPSLTIAYTNAATPTGDYNHNGAVDAADYVVWRNTLNTAASPAGSGADGNQNGTIDDGDYTYWRTRFGNSASGTGSGPLGSRAIPEPTCWLLLITPSPLAFIRRRR